MTRGRRTAVSLSLTVLVLYVYVTFLDDEQELKILTEDPAKGVISEAASSARRLPSIPGVTVAVREASHAPGAGLGPWEASPPPANPSEMIMSARRREVRERCAEVLPPSERSRQPNSKEFLVSEKYRLVWCNVFKAASSTWLDNFLRMAGHPESVMQKQWSSPVEAARKVYPRPTPDQLHTYLNHLNYTSFIIVREPFVRLLSAYRDKLESKEQVFYRTLRCQIKKTYGHQNPLHDCQPSFSEFVNYILEENAKGMPPNEHWAPYYRFCSPCQVEFDYILHFESLSQDEAFLLESVPGLAEVVKPQTLHSSHTNYTGVTSQYFRQLNSSQLHGLLKIYIEDFRIFGYNEARYFDYVQS